MLERAASALELATLYHKAFKKIQHVDPVTYKSVTPAKENGWKFELFLHDILPFVGSGRFGILVVDRMTEFGPVKNANTASEDTPAIARAMLMEESGRWLRKVTGSPAPYHNIEVSPLLSYEGEGIEILKETVQVAGHSVGGYIDHEGVLQRTFTGSDEARGCCSVCIIL